MGVHVALQVGRADLLLALDQELDVARQRAGDREPGPDRRQMAHPAAHVVGRAARVEPAVLPGRLVRRRRPGLALDRLQVEVAVDQHAGPLRAGVELLRGHARQRPVELEHAGARQADLLQVIADLPGERADVVEMRGIAGDRGHTQIAFELRNRLREMLLGEAADLVGLRVGHQWRSVSNAPNGANSIPARRASGRAGRRLRPTCSPWPDSRLPSRAGLVLVIAKADPFARAPPAVLVANSPAMSLI